MGVPASSNRPKAAARGVPWGSAKLGSISDEKLQDLRDRVDVVAVVQRRVPLKKSGRDWKGLCPFHGEKTPSFYVVPDKKLFHCFGCGVSGDAIKFVMQSEGLSFREAVEQLAAEAGVDLTPPDPEEARRSARRATLAEVNEKSCIFYERILWEHPRGAIAREHLRKRGISEETARAWRLGYAPNLWDSLIKSQALKGVEPALVEEAGLGVPRKKGQGLYDRFRGRLMIPIRESGRILGFGGRLLEGESEAKYLNSPDTPLYQKGLTLFGLDRARQLVRDRKDVLFVEGYFDVIGLHQGGIANVVATCGTALTEKHLELVKRAGAESVIFLFDGDAAGARAAQRASEIAAAGAVPARVLTPPDGEDPDELLARVAQQGFDELIRCSQPSLEFLLSRELAQVASNAAPEARARTVRAVAGLVNAAPDALTRDIYVDTIARKLGIAEDAVRRSLAGKDVARQSTNTQSAPAAQPVSASVLKVELVIVEAIIRQPELRAVLAESGVLSEFLSAPLRDAADEICGGAEVAGVIRQVEPDSLRERLADGLAEMERAGGSFDAQRLRHYLKKHSQTVALERKQRPSPRVPRV
ncbi:MAG TPA: DNA primase [Myxococcales bacterium]|nr:DNA primase [Myxococcales bacterium]